MVGDLQKEILLFIYSFHKTENSFLLKSSNSLNLVVDFFFKYDLDFLLFNKIIFNFLSKYNFEVIFYSTSLLYYLFLSLISFLIILIALSLIMSESSIHSIMCLMLLFLFLTLISILHSMEFLSLIFIIVYIGAVCVLMLFHIKLIKIFVHRFDNIKSKDIFLPFLSLSIILPLLNILTLFIYKEYNSFIIEGFNLLYQSNKFFDIKFLYLSKIIFFDFSEWSLLINSTTNNFLLGFILYNINFMFLIYSSLILLLAMIASICLTLGKKKQKKFQFIKKQILNIK